MLRPAKTSLLPLIMAVFCAGLLVSALSQAPADGAGLYLVGDLDEDRYVDFDDLEIMAASWLDPCCVTVPGCTADLDGANGINMADLAILGRNWKLQRSPLVISEFLASNGSKPPLSEGELLDGDDQSSDWLEIYNLSDTTVNLGGWYLTDDVNDLAMWKFPAGVELGKGKFLIVFCSEKPPEVYPYLDSKDYYHTNFALDIDGDYLALVESDGVTIAHEYWPEFPNQLTDISYGLSQFATTLVPPGALASYHVPTIDDADANWTEPGFNDHTWNTGPTGLGFGNASPGLDVTCYIANLTVGHLDTAEVVISTPSYQTQVATETASVINYYNTGGPGHFGNDEPFPGTTIGSDLEDFVVLVAGMVLIPQTGNWTFGVRSDDGFGMQLTRGGQIFEFSHPTTRAANDTLTTFDIPEYGLYELRLVFYERGGRSELELFAAQGTHSSFNTNFRLIGDSANGGLQASSYGTEANTDVQQQMQNNNASLWARIEFELEEPGFFDSLMLRMKYEDAFVAYLNGFEVARDNFAAAPQWNSAADANRPNELAMEFEDFDISKHIHRLRDGGNVLALHGLNDGMSDGQFLILPQLLAAGNQLVPQYLSPPTPETFNSSGSVNIVADTKFSPDRGFYDAPFSVTITTDTNDATIHYTTDGSAPTEDYGLEYTGPIDVNTTTCLRAMAFKTAHLSTDVDSHTYIFPGHVINQPSDPNGFHNYSYWGSTEADYEMDTSVVYGPQMYDKDGQPFDVKDALLDIPTMSLVMNVQDLFGSSGIYPNWGKSGVAWERPASIEFFDPNSSQEFQFNCGIRIYGGVGRREKKKTFRLLFKRDYGPTKLRYPLFGEDATDRFDTIILRAGFNNSWHGVYNRSPQYLRDPWMCQSQLDMDRLGLHSTFVHLYVNGLYWGLYNPVERCNADFGTAYMGGEKEEYDALNSYPRKVVDGYADAWLAAQALAEASPIDVNAMALYVDIPNLIDYMLLNFYGGNSDWDDHNWYSVRRRLPGAGWKFISWDAERTLESTTGANKTGAHRHNKPSNLYNHLRADSEFRMQFADQSHKLLFNNGGLTPEKTHPRYKKLSDFIDRAILCEAARWGDCKSTPSTPRYLTWCNERDRLLTDYFPKRTKEVLGHLKGAGLYPNNVDAPVFRINDVNQHGGHISATDHLSMYNPKGTGTTWYTLDGNDPRLPSDGGESTSITLVAENAFKSALVPTGDIGTDWKTDPDYDDSGWLTGGSSNGALDFHGSIDYVETGKTASNLGIGGNAAKTVTAWAYTRTFNGGGIFEMGEHVSGHDYSLRTNTSDNSWRVQFWGIDMNFNYDSKNKWVHFALVYDGSNAKIYTNGTLEDNQPRALNTTNTKTFKVGRWRDWYFDGLIDDVRIYNVALDATAVQTLADMNPWETGLIAHWKFDETSGNTAKDSAGGNDGTLYGPPTWTDRGLGGLGGVGYEDGGGNYDGYFSIDVNDQMNNQNETCYIRIPFTVDANDIAGFNYMTLKIRYDDGFIAYINGARMDGRYDPDPNSWNSGATDSRNDSLCTNFEDIDISDDLGALQHGDNLLAIHGLNKGKNSTDFLISAELIAGENIAPPDMFSDSAIEYNDVPITLTESTHVKARVLNGSTWSALNEATFAVGPVAENLRITEIMYHPEDANDPNDPNEEFIELKNIGDETLNLKLVRFTNGVYFTFPGTELEPNNFILLVKDQDAFEAQYGTDANTAGEYSGSLSNGGERIELQDAAGQTILNFRYRDNWRPITDGDGFSLTIIDPNNPDPNSWKLESSWRASVFIYGSPGWDDTGSAHEPGSVVINEILANSDAEVYDWLELHNTTGEPINIGGWYLSDNDANLMKYRIADGTTIGPDGYIVFKEDPNFGKTSSDPGCIIPFALSQNGEEACLSSAQGDVLTGYREVQDFGASDPDVAFGLYTKSALSALAGYPTDFVAMSRNSKGSANIYPPEVGPIVIAEIMYHPEGPAAEPEQEYIKLVNISDSNVTLQKYDPNEGNIQWKFTDGIRYTFDPNTTIDAGDYIYVVYDKTEFESAYPLVPLGKIFGPFENDDEGDRTKLSNSGEDVELSKPGDKDETTGERFYILADRVDYSDGKHPKDDGYIDPWPEEPDGDGEALRRINTALYGDDPNNWQAAPPSPGQ